MLGNQGDLHAKKDMSKLFTLSWQYVFVRDITLMCIICVYSMTDDIRYQINTKWEIVRVAVMIPPPRVFHGWNQDLFPQGFQCTDTALTLLRQHHAVQMQNRLRLGDCWQEHDRIFTRWDGAPMNPNSLTHRFHTFIHQTDLPPVTVHSLRHTNATLLIAEGAGVKAVSSHLGHSSIGITGDLYAHSLQSVEAAAAEALENTLTQAVCSRRVGV